MFLSLLFAKKKITSFHDRPSWLLRPSCWRRTWSSSTGATTEYLPGYSRSSFRYDRIEQIKIEVRLDTTNLASGTTRYKPGYSRSSFRYDRIQARIQQIKPQVRQDTSQDTQQINLQVRQDTFQDTADQTSRHDRIQQIWLQVRQGYIPGYTAIQASGTTGFKPGYSRSIFSFDRIQQIWLQVRQGYIPGYPAIQASGTTGFKPGYTANQASGSTGYSKASGKLGNRKSSLSKMRQNG